MTAPASNGTATIATLEEAIATELTDECSLHVVTNTPVVGVGANDAEGGALLDPVGSAVAGRLAADVGCAVAVTFGTEQHA